MSGSEIAPAIQRKYAEHSMLVSELAAIDYVASAQQSNAARIEQIKKELKKKKEHAHHLSKKTQSEFKDVQELSRSVSKRLYLRFTEGKEGLEKKKLKEEQEYLDAFQAENNENMAIKTLEEELKIAEVANVDLKAKVDHQKELRKRLDELYNDLFGGSTNDYPEEDAAEQAVMKGEADYAKVQGELNRESQVNSLLVKAQRAMKKVMERMDKAENVCMKELASSTLMRDIYEIKDLKAAKKHAMEVETYLEEARKVEHKVADLGRISIPTQDQGTPLQFGADKGDIQILRMVTSASKECVRYSTKLETELEHSQARLKTISNTAVGQGTALAIKRDELETIRRKIIENVHHGVLPTRGPWVFGGPNDSGDFDGMPSVTMPGMAPGFPSAGGTPTSSVRINYPAGGFRSHAGSVEGIEVSSPGTQDGMMFPDGPDFRHPTNMITPTVPGFRGAAEMGVIASIAAISFPMATPAWALNPQAAAIFLGDANDTAELKTEDIKMPQAYGSLSPGGPEIPPIPDTPSFPSFSTDGTATPGWPTALKENEQLLYEGRGKFFKFLQDANAPKWEQAGAGAFRMVLDKGTRIVRVIFKTKPDQTTEFDLIGDVRTMPSMSPSRELIWNVAASETVAIRLVTPEETRKFQDAYESALSSPLTSSPQSVTAPLSSSSTMSMPLGSGRAESLRAGFSMPSAPGDQTAALMQWPVGPGDQSGYAAMAPAPAPAPMWPTSPSDVKMPQSPSSPHDASDTTAGLTASITALNVQNKAAPPSRPPQAQSPAPTSGQT